VFLLTYLLTCLPVRPIVFRDPFDPWPIAHQQIAHLPHHRATYYRPTGSVYGSAVCESMNFTFHALTAESKTAIFAVPLTTF